VKELRLFVVELAAALALPVVGLAVFLLAVVEFLRVALYYGFKT